MFDNNPFRDYKNWLRSLKEQNKEYFNNFTGENPEEPEDEERPEEPTPHYNRILDEIDDAADSQQKVHEVLKRNSKDLHPDHLERAVEHFENAHPEQNDALFSYMKSHAAFDGMSSSHQNKINKTLDSKREPDPSDLHKYKKHGV